MNERPCYYRDVETCVEETLRKVGRRIALGSPLGLGKANHLINEFISRARKDSSIDLHIFTALTLSRPRWKNELERRFIRPLSERLFGGYPELDYVDLIMKRDLPENIRVTEFYFQPGSFLDSPMAQQNYMSSNYTHAVRDVLDAGINVLVQLVAKDEENQRRYSLSCNPDLTLDFVPRVRQAERQGAKIDHSGPFHNQKRNKKLSYRRIDGGTSALGYRLKLSAVEEQSKRCFVHRKHTHDGWNGDQAYEEMKKYDFEDSFFYPRSLKKYVFSHYERFRSMKTTNVETVETTPAVP